MQKQLKSLKNKQSNLEAKIAILEKEIKDLDFELEINYDETIAQSNFFDHYTSKKEKLAQFMVEWEKITAQLIEIEN